MNAFIYFSMMHKPSFSPGLTSEHFLLRIANKIKKEIRAAYV